MFLFSFLSDSNCSAIKQVTAVLDELNDVKEVTRQRVISLVEQLAIRLDRVEAENKLLKEQLRAKVSISTHTHTLPVITYRF